MASVRCALELMQPLRRFLAKRILLRYTVYVKEDKRSKKLQEVENLSEQRQVRSLTCTADGYDYKITSDDRNLYFNKLGREGSDGDGQLMGTMRVVKAEVEAVRCMRVRGKTVILIVFEGKTSRLVVKGSVKEELLMRIFGGVSLKLSINAHSTALSDTYELRMLSASFMIALVYMLSLSMKELRFMLPFVSLGWVALPFFWLIPCAGRTFNGSLRDQFPVGGGMFASVFACLMLWATAAPGVVSWTPVIVPSVVITVIVAVIYRVFRGRMDWRGLAVVTALTLLLYAPAVSMSVNRLLPVRSMETSSAEIMELEENELFGEMLSTMTVNEGGESASYHLREDEYNALNEGDNVLIHHKVGLLGIPFRDIDFE